MVTIDHHVPAAQLRASNRVRHPAHAQSIRGCYCTRLSLQILTFLQPVVEHLQQNQITVSCGILAVKDDYQGKLLWTLTQAEKKAFVAELEIPMLSWRMESLVEYFYLGFGTLELVGHVGRVREGRS